MAAAKKALIAKEKEKKEKKKPHLSLKMKK